MDFLKFINSNAIRNHLKNINYEFSSVEAAFIVWQSGCCTIEERHDAWKYIVENMQDVRVLDFMTSSYRHDLDECYGKDFMLHEYLRQYINYEERLLKAAKTDEENTFFSFEMYYAGDSETCKDERLFTKYEKLIQAIDEEISDMSEYDLKWIFIKKRWIDCPEKYVEIKLKPDKTVFGIFNYKNISYEQETDLCHIFDSMWFKFPTPFEKGDVLYQNIECCSDYSGKDDPFVLQHLCYWGVDDIEKAKDRHAWCAMDMLASGYFVMPDGQIYADQIHNYLNLEYYDEPPCGTHRTITAMSSFMKNKIDVGLLMDAYSIILNEERIKYHREHLGITNLGLELAGLKEKE